MAAVLAAVVVAVPIAAGLAISSGGTHAQTIRAADSQFKAIGEATGSGSAGQAGSGAGAGVTVTTTLVSDRSHDRARGGQRCCSKIRGHR